MAKIGDRHVKPAEWMSRALATNRADTLPKDVDWARKKADNLSFLQSTARRLAALSSVVEDDDREIARLFTLSGRANAGLFLVEWEVPRRKIRLDDGPEVFYADHVDESYLHVARWQDAFFDCLATRQTEYLDRLCACPTAKLKDSSTRSSPHAYLFAEALRRMWRKEKGAAALLVEAMELTDPEKQKFRDPMRILALTVPRIQLAFQLGAEDPAFGKTLREAIENHRKFWDSDAKDGQNFPRRDHDFGFIANHLLGLAAWAYDRGLKFDVRSDYIPWSIVTGEAVRPQAK